MAAPCRIAIAGAGRMGQAVAASIAAKDDFELAGTWSRGGDLSALVSAADVLVDFSLPEAIAAILDVAIEQQTPLVCGVSGLDDTQMSALQSAAASIAIVYDRNMSQGVAVLETVVQQIAAALGPEFSVDIEETHHIHKKDAPSGTALKLGDAVAAARGYSADDIRYTSHREGEVPGDHSVVFASATERLGVSHSVTTRDVFAAGALRAARWIKSRPAGLYSMNDVLFGD